MSTYVAKYPALKRLRNKSYYLSFYEANKASLKRLESKSTYFSSLGVSSCTGKTK